jgi:hypothetical protein
MLFGETVAVYYSNRTEHTDTLCGQNVEVLYENQVRTSGETHYVSATKLNWLMLCGETVAVYCENRTEHTDTLCGKNAEVLYENQVLPQRKQCYLRTDSLFIGRTIRNTQVYSVSSM